MALSNFDMKMFNVAKSVAATSDFKNFHMGCVITYKKHIIAASSNMDKTHPMQKKYNKYRNFKHTPNNVKHSLHAEIAALTSISYPLGMQLDWNKVKIYIYRIAPGKKNQRGMARPCPACMQAIKDCGIQHVYYTTDDGFAYERLEEKWIDEY